MFAVPAAHQLGHKSLLLVLPVALSASEIRCDKSKIKAQKSQFEFVPQKGGHLHYVQHYTWPTTYKGVQTVVIPVL